MLLSLWFDKRLFFEKINKFQHLFLVFLLFISLTSYNLSLRMCIKRGFTFMTVKIPCPLNPKSNIVYLQPLIEGLTRLWNNGFLTYDYHFGIIMKTALMWTISDFLSYGMLSSWMTVGKVDCPYCVRQSKAFTLNHSRKTFYFHSHCQFLPQNLPY